MFPKWLVSWFLAAGLLTGLTWGGSLLVGRTACGAPGQACCNVPQECCQTCCPACPACCGAEDCCAGCDEECVLCCLEQGCGPATAQPAKCCAGQ
jgi:hypothetical protein